MDIYKLFADSVKDLDVPKDWEYSAWHHDTCASYVIGNYKTFQLQVFVYHANPLKRDEVGEFKDADRFHIFNADTQEEYGSFNDFDEVKETVDKLIKENE
jgi:hypothetical protein